MTHPLLERLAAGPLLSDGAMGTVLYASGASLDESFDALNLFPMTVTNLENLSTTTQYSPRTGKVLVVLDPNRHISEFAYDGFGRVQQVLTPTSEGTIRYDAEGPVTSDFPDLVRWPVRVALPHPRARGQRHDAALRHRVDTTAPDAPAPLAGFVPALSHVPQFDGGMCGSVCR